MPAQSCHKWNSAEPDRNAFVFRPAIETAKGRLSLSLTHEQPISGGLLIGYQGKRGHARHITGKIYFRAVRHIPKSLSGLILIFWKFAGNGASHDRDALLPPQFSP
jgi:hypothetical protein